MISVSLSALGLLDCSCTLRSDPGPVWTAAVVWEDAIEAASSVLNTPMKRLVTSERCFHLLRSVFKGTPFDTHFCWLTVNWKLRGVKVV